MAFTDGIQVMINHHAVLCRILAELQHGPEAARLPAIRELNDRLDAYLVTAAIMIPEAESSISDRGDLMRRLRPMHDHQLEDRLHTLSHAAAHGFRFETALQAFMDELANHAEAQDATLFPTLRRHCSQRRLRQLALQMDASMKATRWRRTITENP